MLVNGPGEFVVKLPSNGGHDQGSSCNDAWHRNQQWHYSCPNITVGLDIASSLLCAQFKNSLLDLVELHGGIYHHTEVVDT